MSVPCSLNLIGNTLNILLLIFYAFFVHKDVQGSYYPENQVVFEKY